MKKILIALSVTLNVLVIAAALFLWYAVEANLLVKMVMEPMHERWVSQFSVLPVRSKDIVFLGDSITEGGNWNELFPQRTVRNRGIGGDVTTGVLARLEQVTTGKPEKIFLLIGTNDLAADVPVGDIVANTVTIIERIHRESPETQVYLQSVLPRSSNYRSSVERLNNALKAASEGKATWIDLYPRFLDSADGSIRDELSNDELHLLGPGYLVWQEVLQPYIE